MKIIRFSVILTIFSGLLFAQYEQTKVKYAFEETNYQRSSSFQGMQKELSDLLGTYNQQIQQGNAEEAKKTLDKYVNKLMYLPSFDELAGKNKGISLEDWKNQWLSEATFFSLCTLPVDKDKIFDENQKMSQEDLNEHPLMATPKELEQKKSTITDAIKHISNHKEKLKKLEKKYGKAKSNLTNLKSVKMHIAPFSRYYVREDPKKTEDRKKQYYDDFAEAGTKMYVQAVNGQLVMKKVPLKEYASLLVENTERESLEGMYVLGAILLCLLAGGTIIIAKLTAAK